MTTVYVNGKPVTELHITTSEPVPTEPTDPVEPTEPVEPPPPAQDSRYLGVLSSGFREFSIPFDGKARLVGDITVPYSDTVQALVVGIQPEFVGCVARLVHPTDGVVWREKVNNGGSVQQQFTTESGWGSAIGLEQGVTYRLDVFNRGDNPNQVLHLLSCTKWQ